MMGDTGSTSGTLTRRTACGDLFRGAGEVEVP